MNRNRTTRRSRAGLTLIEVMLAMVILGMGLSALIAGATKCLAVVRQSKNYETARHLLALAELENPIDKEEIEVGTEEGGFDDHPDFRWSRTIESVGEEEDGLYSVALSVTWTDRSTAKKEEVVTYIYAPEESKGGSFEQQH